MALLELKNITLKLDNRNILNNLSISFEKGRVHAVVGPNGAGKSTLAYTIMGLNAYRGFSGDIIFKNENINSLSIDERARKGITLGWQEPARFEGLRVRDFIAVADRKMKTEKIKEMLQKVGLDPNSYFTRSVDKTLSGGERKKLELAGILALEPDFIILDEPDSGIDIESLDRIFEIIKFLRSKGKTIVLVTHSMAVLQQADHAFLMCNGAIIDEGETKAIIPYFENKCIPCAHKNLPDPDENREEGLQ